MKIDAIKLKENDNVATVLRDVAPGENITVGLGEKREEIPVNEQIPYGHKLAVREIKKGQKIIKYGEVIGAATEEIGSGFHAHVQNIESLRGRGDI